MKRTRTADRIAPTLDVSKALRAAAIQPERFGRARVDRLEESERQLYFWILRQFASGMLPTANATRAAATRLGLDPAHVLATLAHRRRARIAQAMCAIDALGIAPMLGLRIEVISHDPLSGAEIRVSLDPDGHSNWQPRDAVVLTGSSCREGPSFSGCCDVLNFFEAKANADRYLHEHPEITGWPISIPEAIEMGRIVFGNVFNDS